MGFALLLGIVIVGASIIFVVGTGILDGIESTTSSERGQQSFQQLDHDVNTLELQNDGETSVYFDENWEYELSDEWTMNVTASNGFESTDPEEIEMQTLVGTDEHGNELAYEAGGVWRGQGGATTVTDPGIQYRTESTDDGEIGRVAISSTSLSGDVGSGERSAELSNRTEIAAFGEDIDYVSHVALEVDGSPNHDGWYRFLKDEFDATDAKTCDVDAVDTDDGNVICHDEGDETVTLIAVIDGENSLNNALGIEPTIYGGLYTAGDKKLETTGGSNPSITATGYEDGDVDDNETDVLVSNPDSALRPKPGASPYRIDNDLTVDAYPVINGTPEAGTGVELASHAYATDIDESDPNTDEIYPGDEDANLMPVYDISTAAGSADKSVHAAQMSSSIGDVPDIDTAVDDAVTDYLDGSDSVPDSTITADKEDKEDKYHSSSGVTIDDDIDTGDGDVYIGVDGDLDMSDVDIRGGNQTFVYATGDVDVSDVEIGPDDRTNASSLWIYSSKTGSVNVNGDFQGVVYAPGKQLNMNSGVTVDGAIVAGNSDIGNDVTINFDESLRTDNPLENEGDVPDIIKKRKPLDVMFVLDRSGSMGMNDPGQERVDATRTFIDQLNESNGDRVGLYEFNQRGHRIFSLDSDLDAAKARVRGHEDGNTNMAKGIELALDDLDTSGDEDHEPTIVLLSDGENTVDTRYIETFNQVDRAARNDVTIHTVGLKSRFGGDIPEEQLREIANRTGGNYTSVDDPEDLSETFNKTAEDAIDDSEVEIETSATDEFETSDEYVVDVEHNEIELD
ncbi:VWA domain-containing protein [Natrialbaceae archaeon GCM10025810]